MATALSVLADFRTLPIAEQNKVLQKLMSTPVNGNDIKEYVADIRFSDGRVCPVCGGTHVKRNGKRKDGTQKYMCMDCKKSFTSTTNSIAASSKKDLDTWKQFIDCMMTGMSLRKTAQMCGIHRNTAFRWRHKVLDTLQQMANAVELEGLVEADETYFPLSYKGNHKNDGFKMPRKARHDGHAKKKRGLSSDQVCVPCAVNRNGLSVAMVASRRQASSETIKAALSGRIKEGSSLITDGSNAYLEMAENDGLDLTRIPAKKHAVKGIYNLGHINSYHSQLKTFMRQFNGVSTKYLNNYLIWNNFVNYAPEEFIEKHRILLNFVFGANSSIRDEDISDRPNVPTLV